MSNYNPILLYGTEEHTKFRNILRTSETSASIDVQLTNGAGQISYAGAVVTKGVKGTIKIDMNYSTFSSSAYEKCTDELKTIVASEKYQKLKESQSSSNYKAWWFWLVSASEEEFQHNKDQDIVTKNIDKKEIAKVIEKMFDEKRQTYHIEGTFEIEGQSNVPTKVQMYISTLNIRTSMHNGVSVIDTDSTPMLLDPNTGKIADAKIESTGKIEIVPLS